MKTNYISAATLVTFLGMALMPLQSNAQNAYPRPHEVNERLSDQNARIKQGVKSGELTRHEAESLRLKDASIHYQEQRDRIRHDGHLTKSEDIRLNHELNHESNTIYRDKHNDRVR